MSIKRFTLDGENKEVLMLGENNLSENSIENQIKALMYMKYKLVSINQDMYLNKLMNGYNDVERLFILDLIIKLNDLSFDLNKKDLSNLIKNGILKIQIKDIVLGMDNILNLLENYSGNNSLDSDSYTIFIKSCELLSNMINNLRLIGGIDRNTLGTNILTNEILADN